MSIFLSHVISLFGPVIIAKIPDSFGVPNHIQPTWICWIKPWMLGNAFRIHFEVFQVLEIVFFVKVCDAMSLTFFATLANERPICVSCIPCAALSCTVTIHAVQ